MSATFWLASFFQMKGIDRFFAFVEQVKTQEREKSHEILKKLVEKQRQLMDIRNVKWKTKLAKLKQKDIKMKEDRLRKRFERLDKLSKIPHLPKAKLAKPVAQIKEKPAVKIAPQKANPVVKCTVRPESRRVSGKVQKQHGTY